MLAQFSKVPPVKKDYYFQRFYFHYVYMWACRGLVHESTKALEVEKGFGAFEAEVTGSYELPDIGAVTLTCDLRKGSMCS